MTLLCLGLILWAVVHMVPVALPSLRASLVDKIGEMPYKGAFSLLIFASVGLIVTGWRSIETVTFLYEPPASGMMLALLLLLLGFTFVGISTVKCNVKRTLRHPQLVGVAMWATAHLLVNGDVRTTVLFGGMLVWCVATILLLNKRDGVFVAPKMTSRHKTFVGVAIGFVLFIVAVLAHPYIAGVDLAAR